ncbi:alpha/beta fold hydrolase [Geodermatophilus sp. URMC 64]
MRLVRNGAPMPLTRAKERALLARLALAVPYAVPVDDLVRDLWPADPPARAVDVLRVHVSNLRRLLGGPDTAGGELLATVPRGYRLAVPADAVDLHRFERAVRAARDAARERDGGAAGHVAVLEQALALWEGSQEALADVDLPFAELERIRLTELRLSAVEARLDAGLRAGRAGDLVAELEVLCHRHPLRERFWAQLMTALYRADRQSDALAAYRRARTRLGELGVSPGAELQQLERAVLTQSLAPAAEPAPSADRPNVQYVDVDGARVAFEVVGRGPTDLLLLHGGFLPCDTLWDAALPATFLQRLGRRFRLVLCDRRGVGMSDPPGGPLTYDHWVEDCLAVLDRVGSQRVLVYAHEHAGPAAVRLAAEHPQRVAGLVLHNTRAAAADDGDRLARTERMIDAGPASGVDLLDAVAPSAGHDPRLRGWLERAGQLGAGPARAKELHRLFHREDVRDLLPAVRAPVLVLHSARNRFYDVAGARALASGLPRGRLVLLDSADHVAWAGDTDAVLGELVRFADELAAGSGSRSVLAALVAVTGDDLAEAAEELRGRALWGVTVGDGAAVAALGSASGAEELAARLCAGRLGRRAAVDVAELGPGADWPAVSRAVRAARDAAPGTVVRCPAAAVVLGGDGSQPVQPGRGQNRSTR